MLRPRHVRYLLCSLTPLALSSPDPLDKTFQHRLHTQGVSRPGSCPHNGLLWALAMNLSSEAAWRPPRVSVPLGTRLGAPVLRELALWAVL